MEKTVVRQAVPLQPMEDDGGVDIHLQPMEYPMLEQPEVALQDTAVKCSSEKTERLICKSPEDGIAITSPSRELGSFLACLHAA
ncbi:AN1-type zinc finger protein 5-like [Grus japonensis]|uniref:AN1-type zinc finger protein 5-like n=1 Tax=Grus japonensis TaxID=30415 RepID=A0ABC9WPC1_GRUJA